MAARAAAKLLEIGLKKTSKGPRGGKYIPAIDPNARSLRESEYFYNRGKKYLRS